MLEAVKKNPGTAIFWGAIGAQLLVFALYLTLSISYLWYNVIGCAACLLMALALQPVIAGRYRRLIDVYTTAAGSVT